MATRSLIGIKLEDNIVKIIYCHWDGYPSHTGKLLIENYSTPATITELMELGDLSSLAESPDQCKAYHRDRNEPWGMVEPRDINYSELVDVGYDYGVDYVYVYNEECELECSRLDHVSGELSPVEILSELALN